MKPTHWRSGTWPFSRRHCVIEGDRNRFRIRDLGTVNRTFVNDLPVTEQLLAPGDQVRIGDSRFLVVFEADRITTDAQTSLDQIPFGNASTLTLLSEDAQYGRPDQIADKVPQSDRTARHLKTLVNIAVDLPRRQGFDPLARALLDCTLEAIPAQRAALLFGRNAREFTRMFYKWRKGGEEPFAIPATIVGPCSMSVSRFSPVTRPIRSEYFNRQACQPRKSSR